MIRPRLHPDVKPVPWPVVGVATAYTVAVIAGLTWAADEAAGWLALDGHLYTFNGGVIWALAAQAVVTRVNARIHNALDRNVPDYDLPDGPEAWRVGYALVLDVWHAALIIVLTPLLVVAAVYIVARWAVIMAGCLVVCAFGGGVIGMVLQWAVSPIVGHAVAEWARILGSLAGMIWGVVLGLQKIREHPFPEDH